MWAQPGRPSHPSQNVVSSLSVTRKQGLLGFTPPPAGVASCPWHLSGLPNQASLVTWPGTSASQLLWVCLFSKALTFPMILWAVWHSCNKLLFAQVRVDFLCFPPRTLTGKPSLSALLKYREEIHHFILRFVLPKSPLWFYSYLSCPFPPPFHSVAVHTAFQLHFSPR